MPSPNDRARRKSGRASVLAAAVTPSESPGTEGNTPPVKKTVFYGKRRPGTHSTKRKPRARVRIFRSPPRLLPIGAGRLPFPLPSPSRGARERSHSPAPYKNGEPFPSFRTRCRPSESRAHALQLTSKQLTRCRRSPHNMREPRRSERQHRERGQKARRNTRLDSLLMYSA